MIYNIIKYTIGLPFLLLGTLITLIISFIVAIVEVAYNIASDYNPDDSLPIRVKEFLRNLWRPIK